MTKRAEQARARELRLAGRSYAEIATELGVSKSTVSLWVRDLPRPPVSPAAKAARAAGQRRWYARRRDEVAAARLDEKRAWADAMGSLDTRELTIAAAVAYWAEGTKAKPWRQQERLTFTNSDPDLVRLFLSWLDLAGVSRDRCRFSLHIHESGDVAAALGFWSGVVDVPVTAFQRPTLKRHRVVTNRHNTADRYVGCLAVRVLQSADLYRRLEGTWWAVAAAARGGHQPEPRQG